MKDIPADRYTSEPEVIASVRLLRKDRDQLREIAHAEHRTLSGQLRWLIERHLSERSAA